MSKIIFNPNFDNIFDFGFMNDFTTLELAKKEYGIDISEIKYNDFYCFSEKQSYSIEELFERFSIEITA